MSKEDSEFEQQSRDVLKASADNLDGHVRSRLTQARFAAVEEARKARSSGLRTWLPAGAVAATGVLAAVMWTGKPTVDTALPTETAQAASAIDDLELLSANESFELLEELEFYDWVESADGAGDVASEGDVG